MILVTGGTGLVGSHLLYELTNAGKHVKALIRDKKKINVVKKIFSYYTAETDELIKRIDWVEGDMIDLCSLEEAFKGIKEIYHCAAVVSFNGKSKAELIRANVTGTENIVNLCLEKNIEKLCHVSSISVLGNSHNGALIDEECKWVSSKKHSAYSISKFKSEMEVWRGIQEGLNAVIVNPSVILGPGLWKSGSGELFSRLAGGVSFYTKGGTGFIDVHDVVDCMIKLMESGISTERFILNSENLEYKNLFDSIAMEMGINKPKYAASENILKIALFFDSVLGFLKIKKRDLTKEIISAASKKTAYSNEKIKNAIGKVFIPIQKSIEDISKLYKEDFKK